MAIMKQFKLVVHQKSFNEAALIINPKDLPFVKIGDILEIYLPEDDYSRLLLQVTTLLEEFQQKDTISIEQSIANSFQLRAFAEVIVNKVEAKDVVLDSVELTFKDQYLARSDMWRLNSSLVNTCVCLNKKIEIFGIRCQVFEMWAQGERVACGVVNEDTKVVYRSASSMVYLFLQMSAEMWDFDINGDLYFEKAINGFLSDLFAKWKKLNCNHDVTIVLFSRTFYEATSIEEFPPDMRECLNKDYKGRFYEDFYRVAIQNERYDDWSSSLFLLKKLFNEYQTLVLEHHCRPGIKIPRAVNSTSSQGNFLEVLNMSLNVFEKHFMDRSFDRTGQLSVVISPGVGVFEVDIRLTNITKQRIIDNGIGSDLVCLGEQPLHAVPLFKFQDKLSSASNFNDADGYNMPHWINLSFYSSVKDLTWSSYVPRIKLPTPLSKAEHLKVLDNIRNIKRSRHISQPEHSFPSVFDYDEYDAHVFKLPSHSQAKCGTNSLQRSENRRKTVVSSNQTRGRVPNSSQASCNRKVSEDVGVSSFHGHSDPLPSSSTSPCGTNGIYIPARSQAISIPSRQSQKCQAVTSDDAEDSHHLLSYQHSYCNNGQHMTRTSEDLEMTPLHTPRSIIGSAPSPSQHTTTKHVIARKPRALINPFDPSHVTIKLTSNRRRWTHVFPLGPTGIFMQQHHYQAIPQHTLSAATQNRSSQENLPFVARHGDIHQVQPEEHKVIGKFHVEAHPKSSVTHLSSSIPDSTTDRGQSWLWGATGEQEWTPAITTGVDWKSLVIPACLPITTDYFPDNRTLQTSFGLSDYILLPEDISIDLPQLRCYREEDHRHHLPLTTPQVFKELISQRLQQSFQIIFLPKQSPSYPHTQLQCSPQMTPTVVRGNTLPEEPEEYLMSIGHIFHKLTLDGSCITVTQYRPRHLFPTIDIHYCYRFRAPDNDTYGVSWVDFTNEKLETFNWSYLDHYICQRGMGEYELKDGMKFWRLRMLVLPSAQTNTRGIIEDNGFCDVYHETMHEDKSQQQEGFFKFLEVINKIRRPTAIRKKMPNKAFQQPRRFSIGQSTFSNSQVTNAIRSHNLIYGNSGLSDPFFRDRVSSAGTQLRTGAKAMDRVRSEVGPGRVLPASEADNKLNGSNNSLEGTQDAENDDVIISDIKKLNLSSPTLDIIEAMKHASEGLPFLSKQPGLPPYTFISGEAILWLKEHVDGIDSDLQAVEFMQTLQDKYILHASGMGYPFKNGFYLYSIVSQENNKDGSVEAPDLVMFRKEWVEVEIRDRIDNIASDNPKQDFGLLPAFESWETELEKQSYQDINKQGVSFKQADIDIHFPTKLNNDRVEWGQIRYHSHFEPGTAYEVVLEWLVATGNVVADMVLSWARKIGSASLHLVPIPCDPFALPFLPKSDPLRGPIFIPLHINLLPQPACEMLQDGGLEIFQEKILQQFGFVLHWNCKGVNKQQQYVHTSGSIFVIKLPNKQNIPNKVEDFKKNVMKKNVIPDEMVCSSHKEYITGRFSDVKNNQFDQLGLNAETRIGFLLSWNYMITKRWKTQATGDEQFMRKILQDLKLFCSNNLNRLTDFWNSLVTQGTSANVFQE